MKITPSVVVGMVLLVLVLAVALRVWTKVGILPPHEFAYGTALKSSQAIPGQIEQFLSLDAMDPGKIQIQTFVGNRSEKNLSPFINYLSLQKREDWSALIAELRDVDELSDQKQKTIRFVKALLPYKDSLRNESESDTIIVFAFYGLKQPSDLSQAARIKVSALVKQLDTAQQSATFDSGKCPTNYLVGNINIYPLALDNTFWHTKVQFASPSDAPVLEIRFMGLKGVFRYLLDEMTDKTRDSFLHLDGQSI